MRAAGDRLAVDDPPPSHSASQTPSQPRQTASARHLRETNRWGTPPDWIAMARQALGGRIELDPMSEPVFNAAVGAERFYTAQDDCFAQSWNCETMLLNPAGGLVVEAWVRLAADYHEKLVGRAIWIGFSVEQLALLADREPHPMDFSLLIPRKRIDFLTPHPLRSVIAVAGGRYSWELQLECGHCSMVGSATKPKAQQVRCQRCIIEPEPVGSPSHSNYVVGLGIDRGVFEAAFAGRGRISHGRLA